MKLLLNVGQVINGRYEIAEFLDHGGMQQVYRAVDRAFTRNVALKVPITDSAQKRFRNSAVISAKVSHPNVARTLDYIDADLPMLVEEYVAGGNLKKALYSVTRRFDPLFVARIAHYLARGMRAAHAEQIIHRDIKPANVLVSGDFALSEIKITDFGIAAMTEDVLAEAAKSDESRTTSTTMMGALPYMAPEAVLDPKAATRESDMWSIGAMIYEMLTGMLPYGDGLAAAVNIGKGLRPKRPAFLDSNGQLRALAGELFEIAMQCMNIEAAARPSAEDIVRRLEGTAYNVVRRQTGVVQRYMFNAYGFVTSDLGESVFFHNDCIYGPKPNVGERVLFSAFDGHPANRAFPIMRVVA